MLHRVEFRNSRGSHTLICNLMDEIVKYGIVVADIRGLDPVQAKFNSMVSGYGRGSIITGFTQGGRSIEVDFELRPAPGQSVDQIRRNLTKLFYIGSTVGMRFFTDLDPASNRTTTLNRYNVSGRVESVDSPMFSDKSDLTVKIFCQSSTFDLDRSYTDGVYRKQTPWYQPPYSGDSDAALNMVFEWANYTGTAPMGLIIQRRVGSTGSTESILRIEDTYWDNDVLVTNLMDPLCVNTLTTDFGGKGFRTVKPNGNTYNTIGQVEDGRGNRETPKTNQWPILTPATDYQFRAMIGGNQDVISAAFKLTYNWKDRVDSL